MKNPLRFQTLRLAAPLFVALALTGCASNGPVASDCISSVANASYTGPYKGVENNLAPADIARDAYCADRFKSVRYPGGFVAIYGSSRIVEENRQADPAIRAANDRLYQGVRAFAARWTRAYARQYPVMTGAGPGLMEAGSRGAMEAGGPSIGYTTYYGPSRDKGDASMVFQTYRDKTGSARTIITDGLIFSSVAIREYEMIAHSAAIVIAPGGTGTEWETFQILETMKSNQLKPVPIYLVGRKDVYWRSFDQRLDAMAAIGTIRKSEITDLVTYVDEPEDVVDLLRRKLALPPD
ncbi:MAG: LOG family protein [Burkholderiaceae bacterium]